MKSRFDDYRHITVFLDDDGLYTADDYNHPRFLESFTIEEMRDKLRDLMMPGVTIKWEF